MGPAQCPCLLRQREFPGRLRNGRFFESLPAMGTLPAPFGERFDAASAACAGRLAQRPAAPLLPQSQQQSEQQSEQQPQKRRREEQRLVQCKRRAGRSTGTGSTRRTAKQTRLLGADGGHANHKRAAAAEAFNQKLVDEVKWLAAIAQRNKRFARD